MSSRTNKLDLDAAAAFLAAIPKGRWTSYGDVAVAAGRNSSAAQGVASWISSKGHRLQNVHRVLDDNGQISPAWTPAGTGLPANASEVAALLAREGVRITDGCADPDQRWRAPNGGRR